MRNWINRIMDGRYGTDQLSRAINIVVLVLVVLSLLGNATLLAYLWYPALALLIFSYYRMLSRNVYRRQQENEWYLQRSAGMRRGFRNRREQFRQRQDYKFFSCPQCSTTVRVPKGKGTINITCPKCHEHFTRKS